MVEARSKKPPPSAATPSMITTEVWGSEYDRAQTTSPALSTFAAKPTFPTPPTASSAASAGRTFGTRTTRRNCAVGGIE